MKTTRVAIIALVCTGLSPLHGGKAGAAGAPVTRPSHADLVGRAPKGSHPLAARRGVEVVEPGAMEKVVRHRSRPGLIARSTILSHGGCWTIVPKGAVLHVPEDYRERIVPEPAGRLVPWPEFHARNRGWLHAQRVTMEQARGEAALSGEVRDNHARLGRVVVAIFHNGPISVKAAGAARPAVAGAGTEAVSPAE